MTLDAPHVLQKEVCVDNVVILQSGCCGGGESCRRLVMVCNRVVVVKQAHKRTTLAGNRGQERLDLGQNELDLAAKLVKQLKCAN